MAYVEKVWSTKYVSSIKIQIYISTEEYFSTTLIKQGYNILPNTKEDVYAVPNYGTLKDKRHSDYFIHCKVQLHM